jgi:hypothetical protein
MRKKDSYRIYPFIKGSILKHNLFIGIVFLCFFFTKPAAQTDKASQIFNGQALETNCWTDTRTTVNAV